MANSFSHLGMNQPIMQPASTQAIALIGAPPAPHEVHAPPPAIRLSPQAACTLSPNSNCSPTFKRCTVNVFPQTSALQAKSKIPLALYIAPYRDPEPGEPEIPIINTNTIVRCRRCRTYINPYVQFLDRGQRWKCNMCYYPNDVPEAFDFDVTSQSYIDRWQRPELNHAVVEFIAPSEYMLRPPQPAVYLFVIDVSYVAVQSGMVHMAAQIIKDALEALPNSDNRAMVGFLTVDSALHFYNLSAQQAEPQMLVVGDLEDVFLPLPTDLLANLTDCKDQIMALLDRLPGLHAGTTNSRNALGPALLAADKLVAAYGGKIVVLQSQLPNEREGALKPREEKPGKLDPAAFKASDPFYKQFAVDCSRSQVSVDLFLFPQNNGGPIDVATLAAAPQYTGGNVYMYPAFHASRKCDVDKFAAELTHVLTRPLGLEAVLRVRASRGIRMAAYHGNFFVRSTDLLSLPNVNPSNTYAVELAIDETIQGSVVCFQTALLHTTAYGERRIRVVTLALPVTTSLTDMMHAADPGAIINILARKAQERVLESKFEDARDAIINKVVDILGTYKSGVSGNSSHSAAQLTAPENLKLLPVLALGLSKHPALRVHPAVPTDVRAYYMNVLRVASVEGTLMGAHPTFYPIHRILVDTADLGTIVDGTVRMPPYPLPVSSERLERNGVFLLTDGIAIYLWVSRAADPSLLQALFSVSSYDSLASGATCLPVTGHPYSERLANIIGKLRQRATQIASVYPTVFVVKEDGDPALRMWALGMLVEDRHEYGPSYPQFLTTLREKVASYSG
ncbi:protein transport protein SEC24 [Blastocladiella britannica]|nr:protein transport protein SEC24 [Blastocladiella britannica]